MDTSATETKNISITELDKRYSNIKQVATKTTTYSLVETDDLIIGNTSSAAFTLTLPAASSVTGKIFKIKKIESATDFNKLTIDGDGSETIDGDTSIFLVGAGEAVTVLSDGSGWQILDWTESKTMAWTQTHNASNVTRAQVYCSFKRQYYIANGQLGFNGSGGAATPLLMDIPGALTVNSSALPGGTDAGNDTASALGNLCLWFESGVAWKFISPAYQDSTTFTFYMATQELFLSQLSSGDSLNYNVRIPVS